MANPNDPRTRADDTQREAARNELKGSLDHFKRKAGTSLLGTFVAHVQSDEGKPIRDLGSAVDELTGGLLTKAIKGIMAPDEPKKPKSDNSIKIAEIKRH
jgi:hypothetical protein